jgi:putative redox protein
MQVSVRFDNEEKIFIGKFSEKGSIRISSDTESPDPTPKQLVLLAVGTCSAIDVISILQKKRQKVNGYELQISGESRKEYPKSFSKIHIHHIIKGENISAKAVEQAIELSDKKYCSVAATLRPTATITTSFEIIEEAAI